MSRPTEQADPQASDAHEQEACNLVKVARIDTHGPTREALVRSGWIDDQTAVAKRYDYEKYRQGWEAI